MLFYCVWMRVLSYNINHILVVFKIPKNNHFNILGDFKKGDLNALTLIMDFGQFGQFTRKRCF